MRDSDDEAAAAAAAAASGIDVRECGGGGGADDDEGGRASAVNVQDMRRDAFWLQRRITQAFSDMDADQAQQLAENVFSKLQVFPMEMASFTFAAGSSCSPCAVPVSYGSILLHNLPFRIIEKADRTWELRLLLRMITACCCPAERARGQ